MVAPIQPIFTWQDGKLRSPQEVDRERKVAEALMFAKPAATGFWGALGQVGSSLSGSLMDSRADAYTEQGREAASNLFSGIGSGSSADAISAALLNPAAEWATPQQSGIAEALFNNELRQSDPAYQLDLERSRLELEAMQAPPTPSPYDPNAPTSYQEWQLGQLDPAYGATLGDDSSLVTVNTGSNNDFFTGLGQAEGEIFSGFLTGGAQAARNLGQIDQLDNLLQTSPTGFEGAAIQAAGEFGIDLGGASGVQAAQALINQMVPAQRQPGSGPMSDADLNLFKQSLPRIINQPGGNELIIDTLRQINAYDMELARITQEGLAMAEQSTDPNQRAQIKAEMRRQINSLQNPITPFRQRVSATPTGQAALPQGVTIRRLD